MFTMISLAVLAYVACDLTANVVGLVRELRRKV